MSRGWLVFGLSWVAIAVFNTGALMADTKAQSFYRTAECRKHLGMAAGFGFAGPLTLPAAIFATGFLEHGWSLTCGGR